MERRGRHTLSAQAALQQLSEARVGTHLTGESPRVINPMRPQVAAPCIPRLQPHVSPGCSPVHPQAAAPCNPRLQPEVSRVHLLYDLGPRCRHTAHAPRALARRGDDGEERRQLLPAQPLAPGTRSEGHSLGTQLGAQLGHMALQAARDDTCILHRQS